MKKELIVLTIAAVFAAPVLAQSAGRGLEAKDTNPAAAGGFSALDRNNDGHLSRDEVRDAAWENRFSELDKDNDGRISQSEFSAMSGTAAGATGATGRDAASPSTTGGMGGSVGAGGTQSGSSTSGVGDKPGQKQ